jgi:hypothetical protein
MRVFGTKQHPVRYTNVVRSGGEEEFYTVTYDGIPEHNMQVMRERGWVDE